MSDKNQICNVCGTFINYPLEDMVAMRDYDGNAHLLCAWSTREDNND